MPQQPRSTSCTGPAERAQDGRRSCEHVFVPAEAAILHADLDAFYASVEQRDDPKLRGRPVVVGGGVVLSASYEARARGVRTAMGGSRWRRLCPDAVVVPPRMEAYSAASKDVFAVFEDTAPFVEGLSIDEAFLDVRGLEHISGTPTEIARRLRARVREEVGLPITVGVARTKFLAKVASGVAKPDGLLVVEPERELDFLHPLPVERLWGVGDKTARKLHAQGLRTVGQVAALAELELIEMLGRGSGRHLHALAHNRDPRRVRTRGRRRSIGAQHGFGITPQSLESAEVTLIGLVDRVARRMRAAQRMARTVVLRLRFKDYARATRSHTLAEATWHTGQILATARALLHASAPLIHERGLTLVGIALTNLEDAGAVQLTLPFAPDREHALDTTLDDIRERFGSDAITRAALVGRESRPTVPLLPD
jgi:DNA polymerase-4